MKPKKTDRQKDQDKKGKDRMSYYMRKKLERENKLAPVEDDEPRRTFWQKSVVNGDDDWHEREYKR